MIQNLAGDNTLRFFCFVAFQRTICKDKLHKEKAGIAIFFWQLINYVTSGQFFHLVSSGNAPYMQTVSTFVFFLPVGYGHFETLRS